jgi:BASS family bile acid:Na+ symporter
MSAVIASLTSAFTLAFVITSMFGLGLGLTPGELIAPLRDLRFLAGALAASFLIVPAAAWALAQLFGLELDLKVALIIFGAVAGAPLVLKEAQLARGDLPAAVSLVTLQVVATVIYLPLALPLLIPGITVGPVAIAMPLLLQILLPLGLGLLMNARYDEEAEMARPIMSEIANLSLALMLILNLGHVGQVFDLLGTGAIGATILLVAVGFGAGWLLGGPKPATRRTLALGTAQRNFAAALVIGGGNFADRPTVMTMLLAASLISMVLLLPGAGEMGRRAKAAGDPAAEAAAPAVSRATQQARV